MQFFPHSDYDNSPGFVFNALSTHFFLHENRMFNCVCGVGGLVVTISSTVQSFGWAWGRGGNPGARLDGHGGAVASQINVLGETCL